MMKVTHVQIFLEGGETITVNFHGKDVSFSNNQHLFQLDDLKKIHDVIELFGGFPTNGT